MRIKVAEINGSSEWRAAQDKVDAAYERADALLSDGREFLAGDTFSAADLTFCALSTPIVCVPENVEYQFDWPPVPDEIGAKLEAWRTSAAGRFVSRIYAAERGGVRALRRAAKAPA